MKIAITLTTINIPYVIKSVLDNIKKFNKNYEISIIIIGDFKTPPKTKKYLKSLSLPKKVNIIYFDIKGQGAYFSKYQQLFKYIPYNSFARRNFADLYAYVENYDYVIRIDDDNYPLKNEDFINGHLYPFIHQDKKINCISSSNKWFNICLPLVNDTEFYPRGFPYNKRWEKSKISSRRINPKDIYLNAGLWIGDPDVDAITRINKKIDIKKFNTDLFGKYFTLSNGTWSPINTQNTCYKRELIPASFVSPYAGRYDDIFSGYILRRIMDHLNHFVSYGLPILYQDRNDHDLWKDLEMEMFGNKNVSSLIDYLQSFEIRVKNYIEAYAIVTDKLLSSKLSNLKEFNKIFKGMKIWSDTFIKIK